MSSLLDYQDITKTKFTELERHNVTIPVATFVSTLFFSSRYRDDPDFLEWYDFLRRKRIPFIVAVGNPRQFKGKESRVQHYCIFTQGGWK